MKTLLSTYLHELHIPFTRSYADKLLQNIRIVITCMVCQICYLYIR